MSTRDPGPGFMRCPHCVAGCSHCDGTGSVRDSKAAVKARDNVLALQPIDGGGKPDPIAEAFREGISDAVNNPMLIKATDDAARDLFAAHALQGLIGSGGEFASYSALAQQAFTIADAMMKARAT